MAITKVYKIIDPRSLETDVSNNMTGMGGNLYGNFTWYHRLIHGSAQRLTRYKEYDLMDSDVDVARALDIIAEEMAGNNSKSETPLIIKLELDGGVQIQSRTVATLNAALKTWCNIHDWKNRTFRIARNTIKYGDCFFFRPEKKNSRYIYTNSRNVVAAVVSQHDVNDIKSWHMRSDSNAAGNGVAGSSIYQPLGANVGDMNVGQYTADDVIRFSLNDEMSDEAPFGRSILADAYRAFKQKELLEDAILIYRIQRAPERRVFYIDTTHVHPSKKATHLEQIRNELKQKRIPSSNGGQASVESIYNPQSMSEDYIFATDKEGGGSKVETLPGGQGLGELQDLDYFYNRLWRALRIPKSYIDASSEGGSYNDGKVGIAYLQEVKFSLYIERLQGNIESTFDAEFKRFLRDSSITVDESVFKIVLPTPSNYDSSRRQVMDNELLSTYATADGISTLSKRFAKRKYLQLTDEELVMNERMLREEKGLNPDGDYRDLPKLYNPDAAEAGGFEGGLGSFSGGPSSPTAPAPLDDLNPDDMDDVDAAGDEAGDKVEPLEPEAKDATTKEPKK